MPGPPPCLCFPLMDYNGCFYRSRRLPLRELFFLHPGPGMLDLNFALLPTNGSLLVRCGPGMPGPYAKRWDYIHPNSISMDFPEYIFLFPDMRLHPG